MKGETMEKETQQFSQDELNLLSEAVILAIATLTNASKSLFGVAQDDVKRQINELACLNWKISEYLD